jgi:hypothetical protein
MTVIIRDECGFSGENCPTLLGGHKSGKRDVGPRFGEGRKQPGAVNLQKLTQYAAPGAELLHAVLAAFAGALRRAADPEGLARAAAGTHPQAHWRAGSGGNPDHAGAGKHGSVHASSSSGPFRMYVGELCTSMPSEWYSECK